MDVGYPVTQVRSQLSGGEIARPTCSSRPTEAGGSLLSEQPVCPGTWTFIDAVKQVGDADADADT